MKGKIKEVLSKVLMMIVIFYILLFVTAWI